MPNTIRKGIETPLCGGASPTAREQSGPHSLIAPIERAVAPDVERAPNLDAAATLELRAELERARLTLAERDSEIAALKLRIAQLQSFAPLDDSSQKADDADPKEPVGPIAAAASPDPLPRNDATYPVLQRLAVGYATANSLSPPSSSDSTPPSQRRSLRRSFEAELEFTEDSQFYAGLTQDISQGGVFIATYRLFPVGSCLDLAFELPDGTHVKTRRQVRWLRETASQGARPGMGVAFSELPPEALTAITEFCRERPPLYMDV